VVHSINWPAEYIMRGAPAPLIGRRTEAHLVIDIGFPHRLAFFVLMFPDGTADALRRLENCRGVHQSFARLACFGFSTPLGGGGVRMRRTDWLNTDCRRGERSLIVSPGSV